MSMAALILASDTAVSKKYLHSPGLSTESIDPQCSVLEHCLFRKPMTLLSVLLVMFLMESEASSMCGYTMLLMGTRSLRHYLLQIESFRTTL